ncbi:MAG: peroxiredoxin family protein [Moheibacter sp.]
MPNFTLKTLDGKIFTNNDLKNDKNSLFIFFDPHCDICKIEGKEFSEKAELFHSTHLYFISSVSKEEILEFQNENNLTQTNITFLQDDDSFNSHYAIPIVPFMCLYNNEYKLINIYKGGVNIDLILKDAERIN